MCILKFDSIKNGENQVFQIKKGADRELNDPKHRVKYKNVRLRQEMKLLIKCILRLSRFSPLLLSE